MPSIGGRKLSRPSSRAIGARRTTCRSSHHDGGRCRILFRDLAELRTVGRSPRSPGSTVMPSELSPTIRWSTAERWIPSCGTQTDLFHRDVRHLPHSDRVSRRSAGVHGRTAGRSRRHAARGHASRLCRDTKATVPIFTVVIRKCYGMAGMAACDKAGLNFKVAWPSAEIGNPAGRGRREGCVSPRNRRRCGSRAARSRDRERAEGAGLAIADGGSVCGRRHDRSKGDAPVSLPRAGSRPGQAAYYGRTEIPDGCAAVENEKRSKAGGKPCYAIGLPGKF